MSLPRNTSTKSIASGLGTDQITPDHIDDIVTTDVTYSKDTGIVKINFIRNGIKQPVDEIIVRLGFEHLMIPLIITRGLDLEAATKLVASIKNSFASNDTSEEEKQKTRSLKLA